MLGSPGEPIIIAGRICYPANFSASATVRRTFAHTLVQPDTIRLRLNHAWSRTAGASPRLPRILDW